MIAAKISNSTNAEQRLRVANRPLNSTSEMFKFLKPDSQEVLMSEDRIKVSGITELDGQYLVLIA